MLYPEQLDGKSGDYTVHHFNWQESCARAQMRHAQ